MKDHILNALAAISLTMSFAYGQAPTTNTEARTTLKLERVQMGVKMNKDRGEPCVSFDYSITVTTTDARIRKPYVTCYYLIQKKDTTRTGRLGAKSGDGWSAMNSRKMDEVAAGTIRRVSDTLVSGYMGVPRDAKVLVGRLEVWHDGVLVTQWESLNADQRARLGLKEDWYK